MGETASSAMSIKSQGNKSDEADLAPSSKKVPEDHCNRKDDEDKSLPTKKKAKATKTKKPQSTVPPEIDQPTIVNQRTGTSRYNPKR